MGDEALFLARVQFAFTVSFHFIFPAFSIGLASFLMVLEGAWLRTGRGVYANLYRYWLKIFAVAFGMGVVSGIVMSYQFGTNWSVFSDKAGPVVGPLMAYEVLTAFFLEAGFLGVMLFGINKVGPKLHFFATCMVALGTFISATWIISTNSWMHTPQGFAMNAQGQFVPAGSWLPRCASLPAHQRTAARGTRHLRAAHKLPDSTGRAGAVADHPYPVPRRGACETARPGACEDPSAAWLGRRNEACSMNIEFQNAMAALPLVAILRGTAMVPPTDRPGRSARSAPPSHGRGSMAERHQSPPRPNDRLHPAGRIAARREVDRIWRTAPKDLIRFQDVAASIPIEDRPTMKDWIDRFNAGVVAMDRPLLAA